MGDKNQETRSFKREPVTDLPKRIGDYELIREIGRGGMGVIYLARQIDLDRLCAVKMLCSAEADSAEYRQRLLVEARSAASLDHPNIVGIYEAGELDGSLFFSMEFVDGQNLLDVSRARLLPPREIAGWMHRTALAIHYAHERGVLHRDLKPANVIIDHRNEPQITDFGLAKSDRFSSAFNEEEFVTGTPGFMAPEQISDQFGPCSAKTDVFGLGAVLYYLLTDRPPFSGQTPKDTLRAVLQRDPIRPRELRPGIPLDLETVALKCLEKDPAKRYANANELADELDRFLKDEPIHARPISRIERVWRWGRRRPALTAFAVATLLLLLAVAIGSPIAAFRINRERQAAEDNRVRAEASEQATRRNLYAADMALAFQALEGGNFLEARRLADRYEPKPGQTDLRGWEWNHLKAATKPDFLKQVGATGSDALVARWVDDGRRIAISDMKGFLTVWNVDSGAKIAERHLNPLAGVYFENTRDPATLIASVFPVEETNSVIHFLDAVTLETKRSFKVGVGVMGLRLSEDGARVWAASFTRITAWDAATGAELVRIPLSRAARSRAVAFSPDGRIAAVNNDDASIEVIPLDAPGKKIVLKGHEARPIFGTPVWDISFSPDGRHLASSGNDGTIRLWETATGKALNVLRGHRDMVTGVEFSPDGNLLASCGRDFVMKLWDWARGSEVASLRGDGGVQWEIGFTRDGSRLYTAESHGGIRLWPTNSSESIRKTYKAPEAYSSAELMGDRRHFMARSQSMTSWDVFELGTRKKIYSDVYGTNFYWTDIAMPAKGDPMRADLTTDERLVFTNLRTGIRREAMGKPASDRSGFRFGPLSPDGSLFVVINRGGTGQVWNTRSGELITGFKASFGYPQISPDNRWTFVGGYDGEMLLIDNVAGKPRPMEARHPKLVAMAFDAGGGKMATAGFDGDLKVWETATGKLIGNFSSRASGLTSIAFSPEGSRVLAGNIEGEVILWDVGTQRQVAVFSTANAAVGALAFFEDGSLAAVTQAGIFTFSAPQTSSLK